MVFLQGKKVRPHYNSSRMLKKSLFQNKFHFTSLGCPRNLVDSEVMIGLRLKAGFESTSRLEEADFIILNTCSFLEASRQEGFDAIAQIFQNQTIDQSAFVFRFYKDLKWNIVTIDNYLCLNSKTGRLYFGRCKNENEFWVFLINLTQKVPLIEKYFF